MIPWLFASLDFESTPEAYEAYDSMSALDMFRKYGVSKRMYEGFIKPTLLVALFAPPETLSAGATMGCLYFYGAPPHSTHAGPYAREPCVHACMRVCHHALADSKAVVFTRRTLQAVPQLGRALTRWAPCMRAYGMRAAIMGGGAGGHASWLTLSLRYAISEIRCARSASSSPCGDIASVHYQGCV